MLHNCLRRVSRIGARALSTSTRPTLILGIETSCDDTAAAVVSADRRVLSDIVASQIDLHKQTGGIVPHIAAREHEKALPGVVAEALQRASVGWSDISAIAFTQGPGLAFSLRAGLEHARSLAAQHSLNLLPVHHLEGHFLVARLAHPDLQFPFVALVVSGGHSQMVLVHSLGKYEILSATRDDALGEAYDKVGMLLNINTQSGECMGAAVERIASSGNAEAIDFPIGMTHSADADFSFSGLKTAVRRHIDQHSNTLSVADVAASFQRAALVQVHRRVTKCFDWLARRDQRCLDLVLCGGVACNRAVRAVLQQTCAAANVRLRLVPLRQCADNAVMIAWAGLERWSTGERGVPNVEEFKDRWRIGPKVTVTLPSRRSRNRAHATAVIDSNVKS